MSTKTSRGHLSSKPDIDILRLIDICDSGKRDEMRSFSQTPCLQTISQNAPLSFYYTLLWIWRKPHIRIQHVQDEHCSTPICESTVQYAVYHYLFFLLSAYQKNMSELIYVLYKVNDHFGEG